MVDRHWGHTVRWVKVAPTDPTHTVTATFPAGHSRDAQMVGLQARCADDPACAGDPSSFTTRKVTAGLEVTLFWGGVDA